MILPKEVKTRHKIRDFKICRMWAQDYKTMEEIGKRFGITRTRVSQIIYDNRDLLKSNKEFEKQKRIIRLNKIADSLGDNLSKSKDVLDVFSELRKEHDGEANQNQQIRITNIIQYAEPGCSRESILESTSQRTTSDNQII